MTLTLLLTVLAELGGLALSFTSYEIMKGWLGGVGLSVEMLDRPETTIELVRSTGGKASLEGILIAVAPASS